MALWVPCLTELARIAVVERVDHLLRGNVNVRF